MTPDSFLSADDWRETYNGAPLAVAVDVRADVRELAGWFARANAGIETGSFDAIDTTDPFGRIIAVAANLALIYPILRNLGLEPPDTSPHVDPVGFLIDHGAFLASAALVMPPTRRTVH